MVGTSQGVVNKQTEQKPKESPQAAETPSQNKLSAVRELMKAEVITTMYGNLLCPPGTHVVVTPFQNIPMSKDSYEALKGGF